jgi:hypothetical protein
MRIYAVDGDVVNDAIVEGLKTIPKAQALSLNPKTWLGEVSLANDLQNLAILVGAIAYFAYQRRPRGSARTDLVDIRRSAVPNANAGVFASTFIPKGTVLGIYPGFLVKIDKAMEKSKLHS